MLFSVVMSNVLSYIYTGNKNMTLKFHTLQQHKTNLLLKRKGYTRVEQISDKLWKDRLLTFDFYTLTLKKVLHVYPGATFHTSNLDRK